MNLQEMIDKLNNDLGREYAHLHFYLHAASMVEGLHREEYREFFLEEAKGEMQHVQQFADLIIGLGGRPNTKPDYFEKDLKCPKELLNAALKLEEEVVRNYVQRQNDAEQLEKNGGKDEVHGRYINIFLDEQILDSRSAVDHIRKILPSAI